MSDSNSALTRAPAEIWRRILLEVINVPYLFDTTCTGSLFEQWNAIDVFKARAHWSRSEWQRKLLRLVCKSWKHFAETKAYRSISFQDSQLEPHILAHAQRVILCRPIMHMLPMPTLWEVIEIYRYSVTVGEFLASTCKRQGYYPRLRRLSIILERRQKDLFCLIAACETAVFCRLTFLHLNFTFTRYSELPTMAQVTLPCLEVLIWEEFWNIPAPNDIFRLPNLRHFGWYTESGRFPLSTLLSYAPTLCSLSIRNGGLGSNTTVLPDLNEFPHLEEFSTTIAFKIKDPKPVPLTYPLHTMYLGHLSSAAVHGVIQVLHCGPVKLRRIQSSRLEWGNGGELAYVENENAVVRLADLCQKRGIRVEDSKGRQRNSETFLFGACRIIG